MTAFTKLVGCHAAVYHVGSRHTALTAPAVLLGQGLQGTAHRYVKWFLRTTEGFWGMKDHSHVSTRAPTLP